MAVADILSDIGQGVEKVGKVAGTIAAPLGKAVAEEEAGYAPQIAQEKRQQQEKLEDAAINSKAQELENQLNIGQKYGTLTPEQQQQYVDSISQLYSHPRHAATLMEKLRQAVHPNGAVATPGALSTLKNATPPGGTAEADETNAAKLAAAKFASKPLPEKAAFLQSYAESLGKHSYTELTPDEMIDAFNKENETQAAQDKEKHQKSLEEYRDATLALRKSEEALHEAQFKASQDPNNPKFKLELEKARTTSMRDEAYWIRAQAGVFGEVNGKPAVGAITTPTGHPVGSMFATQYVKSAQGIAQLNDAGGAINIVGNSLQKLYDSGGSLTDPRIAEALANHTWTAAQLAQGIVGKTLTPEQRDAVTAIVSARENIQGMRKAAGGGLSNEQVNRLEAQLPGANTPNPEYAKQQLTLLNQTLQRLSEGVPATVGGYTFKWEPQQKPLNKIKTLTHPAGGVPAKKVTPTASPVSDDQFLMQVK